MKLVIVTAVEQFREDVLKLFKNAKIENFSSSDIDLNAINCIAWTIQTNIAQGGIEKIVRQGDCILIKPKARYETLGRERHLSKQEYLKLLVAES